MASSMSNEVVVRSNGFDYDSDRSDDKSAEYAAEIVEGSPDESKDAKEPDTKKAKREHYTIIRQKEQAEIIKLVDKIIRMKERKITQDDIYQFVDGYLIPKSRQELSGMLEGLTNPIGAYNKASNSAESIAVTKIIASDSSSQKRREYFEQIKRASRANLSTELNSQIEDVDKFKAKLNKAVCNVKILRNKYDLALAEEKGSIAQELYQLVLQAKKGRDHNHSGSKTA
ncbi:hypothetical protein B484DRAFT_406685 [Ochromonadaceae sp. CCMP2298]|nr:hypothetical protein B484DRAFT_406685 [Ochromonadaceae sp. CCMP2298]